MSKISYSVKIVLFNKDITDNGFAVLGKGQLDKLKKFVQFIIFCYVPWWITSSVTSAAPTSDLQLINNIHEYSIVDSITAGAALDAMRRHTWYLTEEMVVLSLFNSHVSLDTKQRMADKLK